jgi:hypothetical protein
MYDHDIIGIMCYFACLIAAAAAGVFVILVALSLI